MPGAQLVAVISFAGRSCPSRPILEIRRRRAIPVFMVAERRSRPRLEFAPRPTVTLFKLRQCGGVVDQVSRGKDRPRNFLNQLSGSYSALRILATDYVPRSNQNCHRI